MARIEWSTTFWWMRDELHLSGTELECYAVIYSLSLGDNWYNAGVKNLVQFLGKSEPTIISALKSLTEKKLIVKEPVVINNTKRNYYKATRTLSDDGTTLKNLSTPTLKNLSTPTLKNLSPNINIKDKEIKRKVLSNDNTKRTRTNELTEEEKEYQGKMREKFPRIMKMEQPLTLKEARKLKEKYDSDLIKQIMFEMENWKPLLTKSVSAYRTIINWCNRELNRA